MFIHFVCDYAPGDLAWAEVTAAISALLPDGVRTQATSVMSFDTLSTGFIIAQLALADHPLRPENLVIFANTAPRKDKRIARADNEGEGLLYGITQSGVPILAVNSGYSLAFVRDALAELWSVNVGEGGSQFRSRDIFPAALGRLAAGDLSFRRQQLALDVVPDVPEGVIGYVDSFGNIKTTFRGPRPLPFELLSGHRLKVRIAGVTRAATVATGTFNVMEGDLAFAPGSSGHKVRYWELFKRGGSAHAEFGRPLAGEIITVEDVAFDNEA